MNNGPLYFDGHTIALNLSGVQVWGSSYLGQWLECNGFRAPDHASAHCSPCRAQLHFTGITHLFMNNEVQIVLFFNTTLTPPIRSAIMCDIVLYEKQVYKNLMSQANVWESFRWTVSWDFDHCDRICRKLMFTGKSIIQITTFFGYTLKCCWLLWSWGLVSQSGWIWILFLNPQSERLSKGPKR